ncbi:MAG: type IV pilus assembly protein PilE [Candidatus Omnitrophota bacterium]|jgi:type IV pilus assembly protein PilE
MNSSNQNNIQGFTIMELLIAIVIMGVLAGIAVPGYQKSVEKSRSTEATVGLKVIHTAEKIYRLDTGAYAGAAATTALTNAQLGIELEQENYVFALGAQTPTTTKYSASATRIGTACVFAISVGTGGVDGEITKTGCSF